MKLHVSRHAHSYREMFEANRKAGAQLPSITRRHQVTIQVDWKKYPQFGDEHTRIVFREGIIAPPLDNPFPKGKDITDTRGCIIPWKHIQDRVDVDQLCKPDHGLLFSIVNITGRVTDWTKVEHPVLELDTASVLPFARPPADSPAGTDFYLLSPGSLPDSAVNHELALEPNELSLFLAQLTPTNQRGEYMVTTERILHAPFRSDCTGYVLLPQAEKPKEAPTIAVAPSAHQVTSLIATWLIPDFLRNSLVDLSSRLPPSLVAVALDGLEQAIDARKGLERVGRVGKQLIIGTLERLMQQAIIEGDAELARKLREVRAKLES